MQLIPPIDQVQQSSIQWGEQVQLQMQSLLQAKQDYISERLKGDISMTAKRTVAYLHPIPINDETDLEDRLGNKQLLPSQIPVKSGINLVGATSGSVTILIDTPGVSGLHAVIEVSPDGVEHFVQDLDSTNGTSLGAAQYNLFPNKLYQLSHNKIINFGPFQCRYEMINPHESMPYIDDTKAETSQLDMLPMDASETLDDPSVSLNKAAQEVKSAQDDSIAGSQDIFYNSSDDPVVANPATADLREILFKTTSEELNPFALSTGIKYQNPIVEEDDNSSQTTVNQLQVDADADTYESLNPTEDSVNVLASKGAYFPSQDICSPSMPLSPDALSPPLIDDISQFAPGQRLLSKPVEGPLHEQAHTGTSVSLPPQDQFPFISATPVLTDPSASAIFVPLSSAQSDDMLISPKDNPVQVTPLTTESSSIGSLSKEVFEPEPHPASPSSPDLGLVMRDPIIDPVVGRTRTRNRVVVSDAPPPVIDDVVPVSAQRKRGKRSLPNDKIENTTDVGNGTIEEEDLDLFAFPAHPVPKKRLGRKIKPLAPVLGIVDSLDDLSPVADGDDGLLTTNIKGRPASRSTAKKTSPHSKKSSPGNVFKTPLKRPLPLTEDQIVSPSNSVAKKSKRLAKLKPEVLLPIVSLPTDTPSKESEKKGKRSKRSLQHAVNSDDIVAATTVEAAVPESADNNPDSADIPPVRVLFTGIIEDDHRREIVEILGGTIVYNWEECTHFDIKWLEASKKEGKFSVEAKYLLKDQKTEKLYKFTLKKTLAAVWKTGHSLLFSGRQFFSTANVKPGHDELREILNAAGGDLIMEESELTKDTIIIADLADTDKCSQLQKMGYSLQSVECVLTGILRQEMDLISSILPLPSKGGKSRN
ncbi:hypothetical protein BASA62_007435 [Batrachochytrium salamandrivorans]|nr:hypothetical protein BASA62_007435 [Batrachochytrium salamandrivorans]